MPGLIGQDRESLHERVSPEYPCPESLTCPLFSALLQTYTGFVFQAVWESCSRARCSQSNLIAAGCCRYFFAKNQ